MFHVKTLWSVARFGQFPSGPVHLQPTSIRPTEYQRAKTPGMFAATTWWATKVILCWVAFFVCFLCPNLLGTAWLLAQRSASDVPEVSTPKEIKTLNRLLTDEASTEHLIDLNAGSIDALLNQFSRDPAASLRSHQRTFRRSLQGTRSGKPANHFTFQEILRLTTLLKRRQEFLRYAEFGVGQTLSDDKIALHAAVALTDARKYAAAAAYYDKWLNINFTKPVNYLRVLVEIEMGRLWYLSQNYQNAEQAFRRVLAHLDSDRLSKTEKSQLLRNSEITYRMMARSFLKAKDIPLAKKMYELTRVDRSAPVNFLNQAQIAFAADDLKTARQLVQRFIAKSPNNSESYQLLLEIYRRENGETANQKFVDDLELFRRKYQTGKVLDDYLVQFYIKTGKTKQAKTILQRQRSDTLWRDRANRKLIELALEEKNLDELLAGLTIEVDEHETLSSIRSILNSHVEDVRSLEGELIAQTNKAQTNKSGNEPQLVASLCLLLYSGNPEAALVKQVQRIASGLLEQVVRSKRLTDKQKIKLANLIGKECVTKQKYEIAVKAFEQCLNLNQNAKEQWLDKRVAFDALLSCSFCHCRLLQSQEAFFRFEQAEKVLRYSPSILHMQAWLNLHFGRFNQAIVSYDAFLNKFDKAGLTSPLSKLVERVRLEMALSFVARNKPSLAREFVEQVFDRNPLGPDLDALKRNNQKYEKELTELIDIIDGVRNGGPFALGRN